MGEDRLDAALLRGALRDDCNALASALAPGALVWLRCCSAFGNQAGHDFAARLAERLRVRVAGHTFIIGFWQSGAHSLAPGATPHWNVGEGVDRAGAKVSTADAPNTLTCLRLRLPDGW
jgi:hypothetical protein